MSATLSWALVTGAGCGIGRSIAERLMRDGRKVIGVDVNGEALDKLAAEWGGGELATHPFDLADTGAIAALVQQLAEAHGPITALVNNAGIWPGGPIVEMSDATWDAVLAVNLTAPFALMRAVVPLMETAGGGAVVNIASRNAFRSSTNNAAYDASKAGLVALTRTAAGEFAAAGIRVNAVCPGVINTPGETALNDPHFNAAYIKQIPMDRYGRPEEIAATTSFLLGDDASFITGQTLVVDGGQLTCQDNQRFMQIPGLGQGA